MIEVNCVKLVALKDLKVIRETKSQNNEYILQRHIIKNSFSLSKFPTDENSNQLWIMDTNTVKKEFDAGVILGSN